MAPRAKPESKETLVKKETTDIATQAGSEISAVTENTNPVLKFLFENPDFSIKKMKQMMKLSKEFEAEVSRKAYFVAMCKFQALVPTIPQTGVVDYTPQGKAQVYYKHSTLKDIDTAIKESLEVCGLSYNFMPEQKGNSTMIVTQISHIGGHTERFPLHSPVENGQIKGIKALQSTNSYLKRYGLSMALGLISGEIDDENEVEPEIYDNQGNVISEAVIIDADQDDNVCSVEKFNSSFPAWEKQIKAGKLPERMIQYLESKGTFLTADQKTKLHQVGN